MDKGNAIRMGIRYKYIFPPPPKKSCGCFEIAAVVREGSSSTLLSSSHLMHCFFCFLCASLKLYSFLRNGKRLHIILSYSCPSCCWHICIFSPDLYALHPFECLLPVFRKFQMCKLEMNTCFCWLKVSLHFISVAIVFSQTKQEASYSLQG